MTPPDPIPPTDSPIAPPVPELPVTVTRKFLVGALPKTLDLGEGCSVENGYLCVEKDGPEIFIRRAGDAAVLCVRSDSGLDHSETEVPLDPMQLQILWPLTEGRRACRISHQFTLDEIPITLDLYQGRLNWLRIAEAEFKGRRDAELFSVPSWMYREVTDIIAYRNSNLSRE